MPYAVLMALSLTETGRQQGGTVEPWPWTLNDSGTGHYFATRAEAEAHLASALRAGRNSIDLGCFQINYRWHGQDFANAATMLSPLENALYAANYLADLYQEFRNWSHAAGAYHSRTEVYALRYRSRFDTYYANFNDTGPRTGTRPLRPAGGPLFGHASGMRGAGSLVRLNLAENS